MKNLLVYTNPTKKFDDECALLVKIQISNSLDLGWAKEDIVLVTNFKYKYRDIESLVIDDIYYKRDKASNKMPVIDYLFEHDLIEDRQTYWYHDIDAFQNHIITESELALDNFDLGLTDYGYKPHWQCGSFFFKKSANDIFGLLNDLLIERRCRSRADERAFKYLTDYNMIDERRYTRLNMTYNYQYLYLCRHFYYQKAIKPIRVLHFHPFWTSLNDKRLHDLTNLDMFMYGKNRMNIVLMTKRLIKTFHKYGIK